MSEESPRHEGSDEAAGASGHQETPSPSESPDEVELTDPAHRAARWLMVLAPVVLVVVVFLLLRLSTG